MAQTLAAVPTTAITTDALAVAMAKAVAKNVGVVSNLSPKEVKVLGILGLAYELQATGGTDYTSDHAKLITDMNRTVGRVPLIGSGIDRMKALADWDGGSNVGTDVATLRATGRTLAQLPEDDLDRILVFLRYQNGG